MDNRRLILFIVLSLGLMLGWEKLFPSPKSPTTAVTKTTATATNSNNLVSNETAGVLADDKTINVTTDLIKAQISTVGGDLRNVSLVKYSDYEDTKKPYQLLLNQDNRVFVAQTGLVSNYSQNLPTHKTIFKLDNDITNYALAPQQNSLTINLTSTLESGAIVVVKSYTFKRDSYVIDVSYQIINNSLNPLTNLSAYWRFLRDEQAPAGETKFVHTFTGPVYYNNEAKFNAVKFSNLTDNSLDYPQNTNNGWIGFTEHYFTGLWLLNPNNHAPICSNGVNCHFNLKTVGSLASSGIITDLPVIKAHSNYSIDVPMYVGPQEYHALASAAPELERTKDYGWVYIFATPLFWLLVHIHEIVKNWGWAIILLTLFVKVVVYPLTHASYKSMAKMRALAPEIESLKKRYGDDRAKLQQETMKLYKDKKINPIGGCLPMLLQIPVFLGLYWALLGSVELRQAHFLWINDLSRPDPYYILPVVLAIAMFLQTFLNPPAADPVQAKMMRIMPLAFSVMFFFFPAGLVVYWLVNNVLTMAQQWYVNNHVSIDNKKKK
jgi:YidC/Oxa1 family membrane protein insertase